MQNYIGHATNRSPVNPSLCILRIEKEMHLGKAASEPLNCLQKQTGHNDKLELSQPALEMEFGFSCHALILQWCIFLKEYALLNWLI